MRATAAVCIVRSTLAVALLTSLSASLRADDDAATPPPSDSAPPVVREALVVTASLEPEAPERLPVAVEVIEAEEIERRSTGDALDLLRTVPGLAVVQAGSPGKQASVFTRGAASYQTLVVWNGVELNDPAFGGFDWAHLSTDGVERIEVAKGPYSAVWGSAAMGGVVQLVTARGGSGGSHGSGRIEGGTHGSGRASGAGGTTWGALALDLAGHWRTTDGELDNDGYEGGEIDLRAELAPRASESSRVGLLVRANDAEIGLPYDFVGPPAPERHQTFDSTMVALPASWQGGRWSLQGSLAWIESSTELADPNDPFAASTTDAERETLRAVARRSFPELGWLAFGGEVERETATSSSAFGPGLADDEAESDALFAQAGAGRGRWSAELGVRRDDHDAFGGETSVRGGVVVRAHDRLLLRASVGESFRAPSLGDLYFPGFSNPELQPERGQSVEAGVEISAGDEHDVRIALYGFDNRFRDLILFDLMTFAPANIGRAQARGVELSVSGRWRRLDLALGASFLDTEDEATGAPLPRRPDRSGSLVASWRGERLGLHGSFLAVSDREDLGGVPLSGYEVLDLGASFAWTSQFEPYLRVENALDREYEETVGFPAPGRIVTAGVALRRRP